MEDQKQIKEYRSGPLESLDDIRLAIQELIASFNEVVHAINKLIEPK